MNQNQSESDYSTVKITPQLISQIVDALRNKAYGSIEIYVENYNVTQITQRTITKLKKNESKNISITISRQRSSMPQVARNVGSPANE